MNKLWSVMLVCAMALGSQDVWAKRVGALSASSRAT
jgi:hypothetical protein